jgi:hypothetical protein
MPRQMDGNYRKCSRSAQGFALSFVVGNERRAAREQKIAPGASGGVPNPMIDSHHQNPRWLSRRGLLQGAAAAAATVAWPRLGRTAEPAKDAADQEAAARNALDRAVKYLWSQQADDGGWHSPQYGVLRSGQALTPFVLHTLLRTIDLMSSDDYGRVLRAGRFILERLDDQGAVGLFDTDVAEYPVYSTSYAIRALERSQSYRDMHGAAGTTAIQKMGGYLTAAQFDEEDGFQPDDPAYGGWGFQHALAPGRPGHMDLAHTRRALEALHHDFPNPAEIAIGRKAERFLRVVQKLPQAAARPQVAAPNHATLAPPPSSDGAESALDSAPPFDGGFYFSPVVLEANKGRREDEPTPHWRSYATATCDGILALLAAGVRPEDERVTAAVAWLQSHTDLDYPQGVPTEHPEPWGEAIRFYHYAVRAEVYRKLDWSAAERLRLATAVAAKQDADGSFVNRESALMKEDDPVMCTALAVVALSNCLRE